MNVLMISTEKLPVPPIHGGAIQTYISGVGPILAKEHKLTILGRTDPALPTSNTEGNITYERVPSDGSLEKYSRKIIGFLQGHSYDLIHIFNRPRLVPPVREAAPNSRIILSMHNDMFIPRKITRTRQKSPFPRWRRLLQSAIMLAAPSNPCILRLAENYAPSIQGWT